MRHGKPELKKKNKLKNRVKNYDIFLELITQKFFTL